jgi:hypothetical protein
MNTEKKRRRAARASWVTRVLRSPAEADSADVDFWLGLDVAQRIELTSRLSLEAFRRAVGDPDARPQLQRSALRISPP